MFPATGSTITAATRRLPERSAETESSVVVPGDPGVAEVPGGTPGLDGSPKVARPDPALTRNESACAVVAAFELDDRAGRPVAARASRRVEAVASVPELTIRTTSTDEGTSSQIKSASSTSATVVTPKRGAPTATPELIASTTSGWAWPRI